MRKPYSKLYDERIGEEVRHLWSEMESALGVGVSGFERMANAGDPKVASALMEYLRRETDARRRWNALDYLQACPVPISVKFIDELYRANPGEMVAESIANLVAMRKDLDFRSWATEVVKDAASPQRALLLGLCARAGIIEPSLARRIAKSDVQRLQVASAEVLGSVGEAEDVAWLREQEAWLPREWRGDWRAAGERRLLRRLSNRAKAKRRGAAKSGKGRAAE